MGFGDITKAEEFWALLTPAFGAPAPARPGRAAVYTEALAAREEMDAEIREMYERQEAGALDPGFRALHVRSGKVTEISAWAVVVPGEELRLVAAGRGPEG